MRARPGTGCGLPGPSAERRLKTKLPAGCSAAWRYHRGKWSMLNTLALSSALRNFLQGERSGFSLHIWEQAHPFSFSIHSHRDWAKGALPLCFSGLAGRKRELLTGGAPDSVPSTSCLFQSQTPLQRRTR